MGGLAKLSTVVLSAIICLSAFFGWQVLSIEFDYDFQKFFPTSDEETRFFYEHGDRFETDSDFIFVALERKEGVFNQKFLTKVYDFVEDMKEDTSVVEVTALTHMKDMVKTPFSPAIIETDFLHIDQPEEYEKDSNRIFSREENVGFFINEKADALLVWIKHEKDMPKAACDALVDRIDERLADNDLKDFRYAGRAVGMGYYVDQMQYETMLFIGLSFGLVIVFLVFTFRSIWGIIVPLSVVALSMLWIVGFMSSVGQPINLVLTVLPSIIFVVAMSDVIHLVSKYFEELRIGRDKITAIRTAYKEVGFATLLTSLTTSIGFLTLLTIDMKPIRDFGIYISIGVMLAFFLAYTFLPSLLVLTKPPKIALVQMSKNLWYNFLHSSFCQVLKFRRAIFWGFVVLIGICIYGMSLVDTNYYLLEDLKEESSLRKDYKYFDTEFTGLRPFELSVRVKEEGKSITDYEVLKEVNKIDEYINEVYGVRQTFSIISVLKLSNRIEHGGQNKYYSFPTESEAEDYLARIQKYDSKGRIYLLIDSTGEYGRISSTLGDVGRYEIEKRNKDFWAFVDKEIDTDLLELQLTGTSHLLDKNMTKLSRNLSYGLLLAVGIVSLLMGFLYRSLRIVLIAIVPNVLPLVILAAILGFSGISLSVSTAIIFTISFGIAVDDTIHFMSKFKLEMNKGKPFLYALKRTYLSTGRAIILTTLILCSGFLLLMLSDFLGTFYVGLLICCTLFAALLADLLLLPILMLYFYKYKK